MKGSEIITSVQGQLEDTDFSDDLILEAHNWFQEELFNDTATRIMETSDTIEAAEGDFTAEMPEDFDRLLTLYLTDPQVIDLTKCFMEYKDFMARFANFETATAAQAYNWTDFANGLRFAAPLNADHVFGLDYLRKPVPITTPSKSSEIPDNHRELTVKGTLARCMEVNEDFAEAAQIRNNIIPLITTFKRKEGRGGFKTGPIIMRTNGRKNNDW